MKKTISALLIPTMLGTSAGIMTYASKTPEKSDSQSKFKPVITMDSLRNEEFDRRRMDNLATYLCTVYHGEDRSEQALENATAKFLHDQLDNFPVDFFISQNQIDLATVSEEQLDSLVDFKKAYLGEIFAIYAQVYEAELEKGYYGKTVEEKRHFVLQQKNPGLGISSVIIAQWPLIIK